MTTINQDGSGLYLDNTVENGSCLVSINSTPACNVSLYSIITPYRVPSGTASNPIQTEINQIGCTVFSSGTKITSSSAGPINITNTSLLPVGTYMLIGGLTTRPSSGTINVTKYGCFFDKSADIVDSTTNGTPYFSSASYVFGNSMVIASTSGGGIRYTTTMIINLIEPTNIFLNYYCQYVNGQNHQSTFKLQITRIG
jgi:hypothetical protein